MGRSRRTVIDGGFQTRGQAWTESAEAQFFDSDPFFASDLYAEFDLGFEVHGGVSTVTLWPAGILSFGPATAEQIAYDFDANGGPANFPGFYIQFSPGDTSYDYAIGLVDFDYDGDGIFSIGDVEPAAFFQFGLDQVILVQGGFTIITGSSPNGTYGHHIGNSDLFVQYDGSPSDEITIERNDVANMFSFFGTANADTLAGTAFDDVLVGDGGADSLTGLDGDDDLRGGADGDTLDGGAGVDRARYDASAGAVSINLANLTASGGDAAGDLLIGIESLLGSDHNDTLRGDAGDNGLWGEIGNDRLHGAGGNDSIDGGAGQDFLTGGAGNDTIRGGGIDLSDIDNIRGGRGDDFIYGDAGDDILNGEADFDSVSGGAGNDKLVDKEGGDTLAGGTGDDLYIIVSATTVIQENTLEGIDTVRSKVSYTLPDNVENLGFQTPNAVSGTGNALDNRITSGKGDDTLEGGNGNDTLKSGNGADVLRGGSENDRLEGDSGADTLFGNGGDDTLNGGDGADILRGGTGHDRLVGDKGADTLLGGSGNDVFLFRDDSQHDTIDDFEDGIDLINLVDYREENGGTKLAFDQLLITQVGADTRIQLDLDKNGVADVIDLDGDATGDAWSVTLLNINAADITAADFVF